jgi:hypothetical protein
MLLLSLLLWGVAYTVTPEQHWAALAGSLYTLTFLFSAIRSRLWVGVANELTDLTHRFWSLSHPTLILECESSIPLAASL